MRYRETGQVHMDFHRTTNGTIAYLRKTYGNDFLDETFRRTARDVYRSIHEALQQGDVSQLAQHWTYFFDREGGEYELAQDGDDVTFTVSRCPAIAYLREKGVEIDEAFCRQTVVANAALAEGTPFSVETDVRGNGQCVQTVRSRP